VESRSCHSSVPISMLLTWGEMLGHGHDIKEGTSELVVTCCIYGHSSDIVCELMESFHAGIFSTSSPGSRLGYKKCKGATSDACRIYLQPRPSGDEDAGNPLMALKMRFVRGEISEDEYRRKREILLER